MSFDDLPINDQIEYAEWTIATAQQEFELRVFPVECKLCDRYELATQQKLEAKGWLLNTHGEFCPNHNYELHGQPRSKHDFIFKLMRDEAISDLAH